MTSGTDHTKGNTMAKIDVLIADPESAVATFDETIAEAFDGLVEHAGISGIVGWELRDADGNLKSQGEVHNLVTQVGDQIYGERGAGVSGAAAVPTGMHLGTGSTAAAKTGAGAAVVTYLSGSNLAFDGGFPSSALNSTSRRITYKCTYGPGVATSASPITEVVIVNATIATNSAATAANTMARAIISPGAKAAGDSLTVTWTHDLLGA